VSTEDQEMADQRNDALKARAAAPFRSPASETRPSKYDLISERDHDGRVIIPGRRTTAMRSADGDAARVWIIYAARLVSKGSAGKAL
jgi:hypothetical protein